MPGRAEIGRRRSGHLRLSFDGHAARAPAPVSARAVRATARFDAVLQRGAAGRARAGGLRRAGAAEADGVFLRLASYAPKSYESVPQNLRAALATGGWTVLADCESGVNRARCAYHCGSRGGSGGRWA